MSLKIGDILELSIDKLTFQGAGLARSDNFVVFVPNSCPGDKVLAKITKRKPSFAEAEIIEVISPSSFRQSPPCQYFSECGGCQWQHIDYQTQIQEKSMMIEDYFKKQLKNSFGHTVKVTASSNELHYRNRVRLHWDGKNLGYFKKATHQIIPINSCLIANEKINSIMSKVRLELEEKHSLQNREVDIFLDHNHSADFRISPQNAPALSFRQVNDSVNLALLQQVKSQLNANTRSIYDLYCGEGNFSFFLADGNAATVIGIESSRESIRIAKEKKARRQYLNLDFVNRDVLDFLRELKAAPSNSCFVLDPPRAGCAPELISEILRVLPAQILFISCDPPTLVRDLRGLSGAYEVSNFFAFDMFPQTFHIESLVSLNLKTF